MRASTVLDHTLQQRGTGGIRSLVGLAALLFSGLGCGVPEYRLNLDALPASATQLAVIAYVFPEKGEPLTVKLDPIQLKEDRTDVSFGVDLDGAQSEQPAEFSVAAKDQSGCIVATGATDRLKRQRGDVVRDAAVHMQPVSPLAASGGCTTDKPVILSAERLQRGLWHAQDFSLNLYGWNWAQKYAPQVRSSGTIVCAEQPMADYPLCSSLDCLGTCADPLGIVALRCKKDCLMKTSAMQLGSSLLNVALSAPDGLTKNAANSVLGQPLVIRLTAAADTFGTYSESPTP